MRQDKLTSQFQQALADAQSLALGRDHQILEPVHVMLSLLDSQGGSVRPVLIKAGADVNKLRSELAAQLRAQLIDVRPGLDENRAHGAALAVEQGQHDVDRLQDLVVAAQRKRLRVGQGLLKLAGEFVLSHRGLP